MCGSSSRESKPKRSALTTISADRGVYGDLTGITAFRNVTKNLCPLVMLATLSFFYTVQAQAGEVSLAWDGSTSSWVAGYQLYYGLTNGSYTGYVDAGNKTSNTLTGLEDGKKYYFATTAYNSGKTIWSGFSNEVSATTAPATAAPVASFTASPTSGTAPLTVTFTDTSTGNITSRSWNFGDGTTSTAKSYTNCDTAPTPLTDTGCFRHLNHRSSSISWSAWI